MTYRQLLARTADVLGLQRSMTTVPFDAPELSKLWVYAFGGVPWALVSPIVDRLRYQAQVRPNALQDWLTPDAISFEEALAASVDEQGRPLPNPRANLRSRDDAAIQAQSVVRSVQRMPCPSGYDARDVANEYLRWLPRFGRPLLRVRVTNDRVARFELWPTGTPLLTLRFADDRSPQGRQSFFWWTPRRQVRRDASNSGRPLTGRSFSRPYMTFPPSCRGLCTTAHRHSPTWP